MERPVVHFSPAGMQRLKEYEADIKRRIRKGDISNEEGYALLQTRVRAEATGLSPRKVKCPDCSKVHRIVGNGQTFSCCSSAVHAVWDCRIT